jgi:two-component system LytT family response regulator
VIRVLVVDDERPARDGLRMQLEREDGFAVVGEAASGRAAILAVLEHRPDLMFLDIRMPDLNGFEVLRGIPRASRPRVIFVTAFDQYAVEAFDSHALDYLLKPIAPQRLASALERARTTHAHELASRILQHLGARLEARDHGTVEAAPGKHAAGALDHLVIREGSRLHRIAVRDIQWIESCGNYVTIHAGGRPLLHRVTMRRLLTLLPAGAFVRIHRGTIVNLAEIAQVRLSAHGDGQVRLRAGHTLRLSRRYRTSVES